jgi:hypothetical protein
LTFHVEGEKDSIPFSCSNIRIDFLRKCAECLPDFIIGSTLRGKRRDIVFDALTVRPEEGSIKLVISIMAAGWGVLTTTDFVADMKHISNGEIEKISDPRRVQIIRDIEVSMRDMGACRVGLSSIASEIPEFDLLSMNFSQQLDGALLIDSEDFVFAEVQDLGGSSKPNAHLLLLDSGEKIVAASNREYIASISENLVYKTVVAHLMYKYNYISGEKTDYRLVDLTVLSSQFDESKFEASLEGYHTDWESVADPIAEIRRLRGGHV